MYAPELKGDSDEITLAVADWAAGRQGRGQKGGDLRLGRKGLIEAGGPREEFTCRSTLFRGKRFQATECLPQPNPLLDTQRLRPSHRINPCHRQPRTYILIFTMQPTCQRIVQLLAPLRKTRLYHPEEPISFLRC